MRRGWGDDLLLDQSIKHNLVKTGVVGADFFAVDHVPRCVGWVTNKVDAFAKHRNQIDVCLQTIVFGPVASNIEVV